MITPKKYPHNLHTPKNIHFSENPKNIEIQNFEPKKKDLSLRMYEKIRVPPPLGPGQVEVVEHKPGLQPSMPVNLGSPCRPATSVIPASGRGSRNLGWLSLGDKHWHMQSYVPSPNHNPR